MFPNLDWALAVVVLTTTADCPQPPCTLPAVQQVALCMELMDPRESHYLLARLKEWEGDLKIVRDRWSQLRDAPPLGDAMRWPSRDMLNECMDFNRVYHSWLQNRKWLFPHDDWIDEAIQECDALYEVYGITRDVKADYYFITFRRQQLQELRDKLGPQMYYAGCLPPHVPVWRFWRID